ncbi:hypothetical protein HZC33_02620 [Candidatus Wolfebacteria bacterium]|nr:hypothetical protein [Candidatus Wolfebacteria bacterium]
MNNIVGLKELRENINNFIVQIDKGRSFIVVRKSKPIFKLSPLNNDEETEWEPLIDFTKIKKGGIKMKDILSRL